MTYDVKTDKAVVEWINSAKSKQTAYQYKNRWEIWIQYCKAKGLLVSGSEQLEDMKKRRLSGDNTIKYFYDNEVPKLFKWLQTEFKGKTTNQPLSETSALAVTTAIRSFFAYHRYSLEIKKESLPSSEKVTQTYQDHAFDIYQLRSMFQQGDLKERTILAVGKDLWLRAGDFISLDRNLIELAIKREMELAENEKREPDIIEFEFATEKEREPCSCHLSRETVELLKDYLKTYPSTNGHLFAMTEEALSDLLRRLATKSKITVSGRIRWHCLRKFGVTVMHGEITQPVMLYMTGKHISKDLRTYIQNNRETFKAFKKIEPLISLTKTNGNGVNQKLSEQLEELRKETFKRILLQKLIEKTTPQEIIDQALNEIASEYGLGEKELTSHTQRVKGVTSERVTTEDKMAFLAEYIAKKELDRKLAEYNNNNH
jgi:hypothetical protein